MNDMLYIVVIYGIREADSTACLSLRNVLGEERYKRQVYIHDNSKNNIYLAAAYNKGIGYARKNGFGLVVLLDDDTEITERYVSELQEMTAQDNQTVFVPRLEDGNGQLLSPFRTHGRLSAFNSGVAIPMQTFEEKIGAFNEDFPLDYLDYWLFLQLHRKGVTIQTMTSSLRHSLSISDYQNVSRDRYQSLLQSERRFAREEGGIYPLLYRLKLLGRAVKWTLTGHRYAKETWRAAL